MKTFYKIENNKALIGSGTIVSDGFIEYIKGQEPQELLDGLTYKTVDELVSDGEALVTAYIQAEVNKFNDTNGTAFKDIHAMANYMFSTTYIHADACKSRWEWNEAVWTVARDKQAQAVVDGLTADEFLTLLPVYGA